MKSLNDRLRPLEVGEAVYLSSDSESDSAALQRRVQTPARLAKDLQDRRYTIERGVFVKRGHRIEYLVKVVRSD